MSIFKLVFQIFLVKLVIGQTQQPEQPSNNITEWNRLSCFDVCSKVPNWTESSQLKASNYGDDFSLGDYFGTYEYYFPWDMWVWDNLRVVMCDETDRFCVGYAKKFDTIELTERDHRFDIRLFECFKLRQAIVHVQILDLELPPQKILNEGCFLSVMINRNPYIHAYLQLHSNFTSAHQNSVVDITQTLHGQFHLCAMQTMDILLWLGFDLNSISVALANVYGSGPEDIVTLLRCAGATSLEAGQILTDVFLTSPEDTAYWLLYGGFNTEEANVALVSGFDITAQDANNIIYSVLGSIPST